jgi:hypothetical protein
MRSNPRERGETVRRQPKRRKRRHIQKNKKRPEREYNHLWITYRAEMEINTNRGKVSRCDKIFVRGMGAQNKRDGNTGGRSVRNKSRAVHKLSHRE